MLKQGNKNAVSWLPFASTDVSAELHFLLCCYVLEGKHTVYDSILLLLFNIF